jgi:hypothetical protein
MARQRLTFLRAVVEMSGPMVGHDTMLVFRTAGGRIAIDSLVRQRQGVSAGAVVGRGEVTRVLLVERPIRQ